MNDKAPISPIVIKKYANRRLYNTETSSYITLETLHQMIKEGADFIVRDAKTGEDLTRAVLTQIIVEQESRGAQLLPVSFLKQLIGFYDDRMQDYVPPYLDAMMDNFSRNQEQIQEYVTRAMESYMPQNQMAQLEELGKQNMEVFRQTFAMFNPFAAFISSSTPPADTEKKQ